MTSDTLNCIYAIKCQGCEKMYIGETNNLRLRTNVHRDHASKNMGLSVSRHIYECTKAKPSDKNFKNVKFLIMPFYKLQSDDVATRRGMEKYFINKFSPALNETWFYLKYSFYSYDRKFFWKNLMHFYRYKIF